MKQIASFFLIYAAQMLYIAAVVCPALYFLQKRNRINHRSALHAIYFLLLLGLVTSVFRPDIAAVTQLTDAISSSVSSPNQLLPAAVMRSEILATVSAEQMYIALLFLALSIVAVGICLYLMSLLLIVRKIKGLRVHRRIGRVTLLIDNKEAVPHVFSLGKKSYVVVPKAALAEKSYLRTAIQHEFQHIRNGDTSSVYSMQFLMCLFWINPGTHFILKYIKSLQEMCVDEALIHQRRIGYRKYLRTLNWFVMCAPRTQTLSLSYSIFGWSTYNELKKRVHNIRRVKPLQTSGVWNFTMLTFNVIALVVISNSSPRFNYSLKEVQDYYTPEYMKVKFAVSVKGEDFHSAQDFNDGFDFREEYERVFSLSGSSPVERGFGRPGAYRVVGKRGALVGYGGRYARVSLRVLEYSDDSAYVLAKSEIVELPKSEDDKSSSVLASSEKRFRVSFNEEFVLEHMNAKFRLNKKLEPKEISYFGSSDKSGATEAHLEETAAPRHFPVGFDINTALRETKKPRM